MAKMAFPQVVAFVLEKARATIQLPIKMHLLAEDSPIQGKDIANIYYRLDRKVVARPFRDHA
jgi:hypothetical protein